MQLDTSCLVEIAKLLAATFRETDVIGRLGGDEFVVAGQIDALELSRAIERLRCDLSNSQIPGINVPLSMSTGYAATDGNSSEMIKSVVSRADHAMYREAGEEKVMRTSGSGQIAEPNTRDGNKLNLPSVHYRNGF